MAGLADPECKPSSTAQELPSADRRVLAWETRRARLLLCMVRNMLRKPLVREGVRLSWGLSSLTQAGSSRATCSGEEPLRPCTSSAARPCEVGGQLECWELAQEAKLPLPWSERSPSLQPSRWCRLP